MKFGENLRQLRKSKNISQEVLAQKVGVSRQSVSKWETGEAYPEMNNILALCTIFHCNINDLVNDNIIDQNSLNDEIRMSVVKFKEKEQRKMKGLSKAIYLIARIFKIFSIIGLIGTIICIISSIAIIPNIKFDTKESIVEIDDVKYEYTMENNELSIDIGKEENFIIEYSASEEAVINKVINSDNTYILSFVLVLLTSFSIFMVIVFKTLSYLEKLFVNIYNEDTPFNMVNISYIKKIAVYLTISIFVQDLMGLIAGTIFNLNLGVEVELTNYMVVMVVIALYYIFKYGYEIQLDSKGKIYGDELE